MTYHYFRLPKRSTFETNGVRADLFVGHYVIIDDKGKVAPAELMAGGLNKKAAKDLCDYLNMEVEQ